MDWEIGERVFIDEPYQKCSIRTITRKTKTLVIVESDNNELRFKPNGSQYGGGSWHWYYMRKLTPERVERFEIQQLRLKAISLRNKLSIPQAKQELEVFVKALEPLVKG